MTTRRRKAPDAYGPMQRKLYDLVSRAVDSAFEAHPDYVTAKGHRAAANSIAKRVVGQIVSVIKGAQQRGATRLPSVEPGAVDAARHLASCSRGEQARLASHESGHNHHRRYTVTTTTTGDQHHG